MKLSTYYLLILLPIPVMVWLTKVNPTAFVVSLLVYCLIYRPLVDSRRLVHMGVLNEKDRWKVYIPFYYHIRYAKQLYFSEV